MNCVIDANVLAVANNLHEPATPQCWDSCTTLLMSIQKDGGCVSVDTLGEIFQEYARYAKHAGQPGLGDAFFKWLFQNQGYSEICELVNITPSTERGYEEYPTIPELENFDRSDRKYVAVCLGSQFNPTIFNAVDSDWKIFEQALSSTGVSICQLCL